MINGFKPALVLNQISDAIKEPAYGSFNQTHAPVAVDGFSTLFNQTQLNGADIGDENSADTGAENAGETQAQLQQPQEHQAPFITQVGQESELGHLHDLQPVAPLAHSDKGVHSHGSVLAQGSMDNIAAVSAIADGGKESDRLAKVSLLQLASAQLNNSQLNNSQLSHPQIRATQLSNPQIMATQLMGQGAAIAQSNLVQSSLAQPMLTPLSSQLSTASIIPSSLNELSGQGSANQLVRSGNLSGELAAHLLQPVRAEGQAGLSFRAVIDPTRSAEQMGSELSRLIADKVSVQVNARAPVVTVRLDPAELGRIELLVKVDNDKLQLQINASSQSTRESIMLTAERLRNELINQHFLQVDVSVADSGRDPDTASELASAAEPSLAMEQAESDEKSEGKKITSELARA